MPKIVAAAERLAAELGRSHPRLDHVMLAIAALYNRPFDEAAVLAELDRWAHDLREMVSGAAPDLGDLCAMLGVNLRLAVDATDYDAPENSFLPYGLENRSALPILASAIWIEIGRRAGVPLFGVGLPGHFVAGHRLPDGQVAIVDVVNEGKRLAIPQIEALVLRAGARFHPEMLAPASPHSIAVRMLRNLVGSYVRRERFGEARSTAQLWLAASPNDPEVVRLFQRLDERTQTVWS